METALAVLRQLCGLEAEAAAQEALAKTDKLPLVHLYRAAVVVSDSLGLMGFPVQVVAAEHFTAQVVIQRTLAAAVLRLAYSHQLQHYLVVVTEIKVEQPIMAAVLGD